MELNESGPATVVVDIGSITVEETVYPFCGGRVETAITTGNSEMIVHPDTFRRRTIVK